VTHVVLPRPVVDVAVVVVVKTVTDTLVLLPAACQSLATIMQPYIPIITNTATTSRWRSGNVVGRINEVTLRRARLVLGWVTVFGG